MIAQTYCGRLREFPLLCNPEDGPCPACLRAHIAKLEARNAELEAQAAAQAGGVVVSEEELVALRCLDGAVTINGDGMSTEALGANWEMARSAKDRLDALRAAKGGTT